jgi:hypothetical protein
VNDRPLKGTGILQAMITMDAVALAALLAAVWAAAHPEPAAADPGARHAAWGIGAALLNLVARCTAIFYMLASGRAVKDLIAEHGLDPALATRSKRIKRGVETLATLALVPAMVAAINGGAVGPLDAGVAAHAWWSWSAVAAAALCLAVDLRAGLRNYALLREVDALSR